MALKFLFDLDAKLGATRGVAKILRGIESALRAVDPQLKMTRRSFYALGYGAGTAVRGVMSLARAIGTGLKYAAGGGAWAMGKLGGTIREIGKGALSNFLGYASWDGLKSLVSGAWNAGKHMVQLASEAEKTGRILERVVGPDKASKVLELSGKFSKKTGVDDDVFNDMAASLLRLGFAFERLPVAFTLAADVAALKKGDPAGTIEDVTAALVNMQTKGGLNIAGFKRLGITEEGFYKQLAAQQGITETAAEARVGKGKISGSDQLAALQAVVAKVAGAPGSAALAEGKSIDAAMARASRIGDELGKSLQNTPAMAALTVQLNRLADLFDPDSDNGKRISGGMQKLVKGFADALAGIDVERLSKGLTELFTNLPALIGATTRAAVKLVEVLSKFGGGPSGTAMKAGSPSTFPALGGAGTAGGAPIIAAAAQAEFERTGVMPRSIASYATKGLVREGRGTPKPGFFDWMSGMMSGVGQQAGQSVAGGALPEANKSGRAIGEAIEAGTKDALEQHSPSRKFMAIGKMASRGAEIGGVREAEKAGAALGTALERGASDVPAPSVNATRGGMRGGVTIHMPVTVTAPAGEGGADAIVAAIRRALPEEMQALVERLRLELGLA